MRTRIPHGKHLMKREEQPLIGESGAFLETLERVSRAAELNRPVLVVGERGTGKELIAERLHFLSARWDQPLVKLNCAAISPSLLESELFGHEAGAFTDAGSRRIGRFEQADGGTLFLDELATTSDAVQEKILRIVEYGEFERLGSSKTLSVDVRVVGATNEDLPSLAARGRFRADLLDRLSFDVITLPPLRERREDIVPLAEHFAMRMSRELGRELFAGFSNSAIRQMHATPGPATCANSRTRSNARSTGTMRRTSRFERCSWIRSSLPGARPPTITIQIPAREPFPATCAAGWTPRNAPSSSAR